LHFIDDIDELIGCRTDCKNRQNRTAVIKVQGTQIRNLGQMMQLIQILVSGKV